MIFRNPAGAPELGCDACGCRWFDRMTDTCYECGTPLAPGEAPRFVAAVEAWRAGSAAGATRTSGDGRTD
jgi:hypothetical protein